MSSFDATVSSCRSLALSCTSVELLLVLFGSLRDTSNVAELFYLILLVFSLLITAHNIALDVDGREEIHRMMTVQDAELRHRSAILLLTPPLSGVLVFLCVSGHSFFSFFVLVHILASCGQLGLEIYEVKKLGGCLLHPKLKCPDEQ